ncbi:MAG: M14 family zinc carboxypeptidase [Oscillospiraceae bacterium]
MAVFLDMGLTEYKNTILRLIAHYHRILSVAAIGRSHDGHGIYDIAIGNAAADCHVVVHGACHGREYLNAVMLCGLAEEYCTQFHSGAYDGERYSAIFSKACLHIVPILNPDGVMISRYGIHSIDNDRLREGLSRIFAGERLSSATELTERAYFTRWKANAKGVDLNRNFNSGWADCVGNSAPSAEKYKGVFYESEPETAALARLVKNLNRRGVLRGVISYHSAGESIFWDFEQTGSRRAESLALTEELCALTGYAKESPAPDEAGCSDWVSRVLGLYACTMETGRGDCPLDDAQLAEITEKNRYVPLAALRFLSRAKGGGGDGI